MRFWLLLLSLMLSLPGWAQSPPQQWIFGQGLGMDFSGGGAPTFFRVPWQASLPGNWQRGVPGFHYDANFSSIYADSSGQLQLYFLNGTYYDGQQNRIWRDSKFIYTDDQGQGYNLHQRPFSWFFPVRGKDTTTLLHCYISLTKGNNRNLGDISLSPQILKINRLQKINGQWQVEQLDAQPDSLGPDPRVFQFGSAQAYWNPYGEYPWVAMNSLLGDTVVNYSYLNLAYLNGNQKIDTARFGFSNKMISELATESIQHPLSGIIYVAYEELTSSGLYQQSYLEEYFLLPNMQLFPTGVRRPLSVPTSQPAGTAYDWHPVLLEISPQGRYLYAYMYRNNVSSASHSPKLMRYDLFAPDSASFANRSEEIALPSSFGALSNKLNFRDIRSAPDGNMYFTAYEAPVSIRPGERQHLGRISNPDTSDPFWVQVDEKYHTFPPWTLYRYLPNRLPNQLDLAPFEQLTYCPDSVQLHFNYPKVTDSLWWSFGDTTLGAANHDTATHPVIPYSEPGKYPVSVELWWRGRQWRTLKDTVVVKAEPELDLPGDTTLCPGDTLWLDARQGIPAQYQWNTGSRDSTLTVRDSGYYRLEVSTSCGIVSDSLRVSYHPLPERRPLRDTTLCLEDSVQLSVAQPGRVRYRWENGDTTASRWIDSSGSYQVAIATACDTITESARVEIEPCGCRFHVPNAFSPNGDGVNDRFAIKYHCDSVSFQLQILNRWGQVIYRQTEADPFWDGRFQGQRAPEGVYLYRLVFKGGTGEHYREEERHGRIMLLR